jgi:glutamate-1-semialdehyde 2,1-aminomutase
MTLLEEWAEANPRSRELHERERRLIPGGITHDVRHAVPFPVGIDRAAGSHKTDVDGHDLVCYVMGHGSLLLGHNPQPVTEAIARTSGRLLHPGSSHELEVEWAERVHRLIPSAEKVRFTSSGTEATMLALQVARGFTGRDRVLKIEGHFHGWHDTAAIGAVAPYRGEPIPGIPAVLQQVVSVVPPDPVEVERALAARDVAALILEPSGASFGAIPLGADFLSTVRELTHAAGTLLVFDEVITGFRWSPGGLQRVAGVTPDLTTMAKIVAGGMPGGALAGAAGVMDVLAFRESGVKVKHPGTHNAHPVSAAAGVTMLDLVADGAAQSRADETADWLRRELEGAFRRTGTRGFVYGASSTFRIMAGRDRPAGEPAEWWRTADVAALRKGTGPALLAELQAGMMLEGVHLFQGRGFVGTAHTEADVELTVAGFERTLARLRRDGLLDRA